MEPERSCSISRSFSWKMEDTKKAHRCTFKGCSAAFNRPYRLAQHLLHHDNIKLYACSEDGCSRSYTSQSHLERHMNNTHRKNQCADVVYSCSKCLKKFANRQNLKRHIKMQHILKVPFQCDRCSEKFQKKHQLSAHMYTHDGTKAFSCETCAKDFITLLEKKRHMRCHRSYECQELGCDKIFKLWSKYQKHLKDDHHLEREYICDLCRRSFKQRSHIIRHIKNHCEGIKPKRFSCPYEDCKRVYSRNSNLKQHILIKHEKVTHNCSVCDAKLSTKAKLANHIRILHSGAPRAKPKPKIDRKPRKDIGVQKLSTAIKLAGMTAVSANSKNITEIYVV